MQTYKYRSYSPSGAKHYMRSSYYYYPYPYSSLGASPSLSLLTLTICCMHVSNSIFLELDNVLTHGLF